MVRVPSCHVLLLAILDPFADDRISLPFSSQGRRAQPRRTTRQPLAWPGESSAAGRRRYCAARRCGGREYVKFGSRFGFMDRFFSDSVVTLHKEIYHSAETVTFLGIVPQRALGFPGEIIVCV